MKINLSNYSVNTNEVVSVYPPSKYTEAQKRVGCKVIPEYLSGYYGIYHISVKQTWGMIYNLKNIKYMIVYEDPDNTDQKIIKNIVHYAFKKGITVFYRQKSNCDSGLKPHYIELTKENNIYHSLPGGRYTYIGSNYEDTELKTVKHLPEQKKNKLRKYLRYYEIETPQDEIEWVETFEVIRYYIKNKMPFAFDRNRYRVCPECKELVLRGTEEEHICYCDIVPEKTHMDYILNGEE